jgi:hypothetical protein
MKRRFVWFLVLVVIGCLILSAQPVAAGGEDATMGDVKLTPVPDTQGEGGPITLELEIPFYGGCCYPLFAYEVAGSLELPENMNIISGPEPQKLSEVQAKAGGEPEWVTIKWVVKSMVAGEYTVGATASTQNCGSASSTTTITITKGCVISIPEIYPQQPSTEKETYINIEAMSPIEGITIDEVTLYYVASENELKSLESEEDTLYFGNNKNKMGEPISMDRAEDEGYLWNAKIPQQDSSSYVYYWVVAEDNNQNRTTSPVYTLNVEDLAFADMVLTITIWLPIILTIISIFVIILIVRYLNKVDTKKEGLLVLGSTRISRTEPGTKTDELSQRKLNVRLYAVFGILITIGIALLIWAIVSDELSDLIYVMGGGM